MLLTFQYLRPTQTWDSYEGKQKWRLALPTLSLCNFDKRQGNKNAKKGEGVKSRGHYTCTTTDGTQIFHYSHIIRRYASRMMHCYWPSLSLSLCGGLSVQLRQFYQHAFPCWLWASCHILPNHGLSVAFWLSCWLPNIDPPLGWCKFGCGRRNLFVKKSQGN